MFDSPLTLLWVFSILLPISASPVNSLTASIPTTITPLPEVLTTIPLPLGPVVPITTGVVSTATVDGFEMPSIATASLFTVTGSDFVPSPFTSSNGLFQTSSSPVATNPTVTNSDLISSLTASQSTSSASAQALSSANEPGAAPVSASSSKSTLGLVLGATIGGTFALLTISFLAMLFCYPRRKNTTWRYSGFSEVDQKPIFYKDEYPLSRSASNASNNSTNRTFWMDSPKTAIEPLSFTSGAIDGSGRLSRLSFSDILKKPYLQDVNESQQESPRRDWPLVQDTVYRTRPSGPDVQTPVAWGRDFPMPPMPVKLRNGTMYSQQAEAMSQNTLHVLPHNLGKLNGWLRDNRRREF